MAPITNAERQAQYRKRLKERASLEAMGARAHEAVDQAIEALWNFLNRPDENGRGYADVDDIETLADFRLHIAEEADALSDYCRSFRNNPPDGMATEELSAISIVAEIADAIEMSAERPKSRRGG